jgi:hypothetical protein
MKSSREPVTRRDVPTTRYKFITTNLHAGDLVKCRNEIPGEDKYSKLIRFGVGSYSNHDAMTVYKSGHWFIAEAVEPVSRLTTIEEYEAMMDKGYRVRIYRLKHCTEAQRVAMSHYFTRFLLGLPYPKKWKMIILASKLVNATGFIPFRMHLQWCSQLVAKATMAICHHIIDGPDGKKKKLWTPKTFENRILQGCYEDVTDQCIEEILI